LREECRLRVFENRVLRRIFGLERDEVIREWRRLHNKELHALYSSQNIVWVIKSRREMGRTSGTYGGEERCIQGFNVKTRGKETTWRRWEGNIKMDRRETEWGHRLDQSGSGQGQVAGSCECGNEPSISIRCREFVE
jgi:hypothetical protein